MQIGLNVFICNVNISTLCLCFGVCERERELGTIGWRGNGDTQRERGRERGRAGGREREGGDKEGFGCGPLRDRET